MRIRVVGAGGVGGVIGGLLADAGHDVALVARGAHGEAIARSGLRVELPDRVVSVHSTAVSEPDLVLLAVKSQDTPEALAAIEEGIPVFCAQNGVTNERHAEALHQAHGVMVWLPAELLEPGVVRGYGTPRPGLLRLGRWPAGVTALDRAFAEALSDAGFDTEAVPDVAAFKHAKLLRNLGNIVDAAVLPGPEARALAEALMEEGRRVLQATGIAVAELPTDRVGYAPVQGRDRPGGSTWQSLATGRPLETAFLNGEIVQLGREHGLPTPLNARALEVAQQVAAPRSMPASEWH